ncbi:adhesion G protein-coupled receptor E1-like [Montipora capricornis]|uniref:adhesion G protein-coupled receptor E1-like n=1 Tax=Montipora capricornis TaxID=246305 RepID=UPI0035F1F779
MAAGDKTSMVKILALVIIGLAQGIEALNECEVRGVKCPFGSACRNSSNDTHECVCTKGFTSVKVEKKLTSCEDVDECLTGESTCSGDRCRNTPGSYKCIPCLPGFTENSSGDCIGIIKAGCRSCDLRTEDCRHRKCRCKRTRRRNKQGRCVLVSSMARGIQSPLRSSVSIVFIGLNGFLAFTTSVTTPGA